MHRGTGFSLRFLTAIHVNVSSALFKAMDDFNRTIASSMTPGDKNNSSLATLSSTSGVDSDGIHAEFQNRPFENFHGVSLFLFLSVHVLFAKI